MTQPARYLNRRSVGTCGLIIFLSGVCAFSAGAQSPITPMTNADVVRLIAFGISDKTVVTVIHEAKLTQFDLSEPALFDLVDHRASDVIVAAMRNPSTPTPLVASRAAAQPERTATVEAAPPAPPQTGPIFDIIKVDDRITESNSVYTNHSWLVTVHNYQSAVVVVTGEVQYLDAQGFILDTSAIVSFAIPAQSEAVIRGEKLISAGKAPQVKSIHAELKRRPY